MLILQQCRNTALSIKIQAAQSHIKPIDTPKFTNGHFIALQREQIQLYPQEQRQASLTRNTWKTTTPTPPIGSNLHNKEEPQTPSLQKGDPKHCHINKMKRQRNIQQVKEHDKCPLNQTKEIGSLPEKWFRIVIVKVIKNLENKMEWQINRLETRLWKCKKCLTRT